MDKPRIFPGSSGKQVKLLQPPALGLLRLVRGRDGTLDLNGRSWRGDGTLLALYTSLAMKERMNRVCDRNLSAGSRSRGNRAAAGDRSVSPSSS